MVGTARRTVPAPSGIPHLDRGDPARTLLDRAALAAVRARAGRLPTRFEPDDPGGFEPAPPESAPLPPEGAARRLADLLDEDSALLLEWLELARCRGVRVPPESLPALLDRCARDTRRMAPALLAVAGRRGLWLAGFDSRWGYLRLLAAAAELTVEEWRSRPAQERHALLEAREPRLTAADEPLLEEALADRSARVRGLAMGLAARLPESRHARRLARCAGRHLRRGADDRPEIRLPDPADPELARVLGVEPRPRQAGGRSRETRLQQLWTLISHAPLDTWRGRLGATPADVAAFAAATDGELLEALANAAVLQRDREWARALLPIVLERLTGGHDVRASRGTALLALLPPEERCSWALERLRADRREPTPDTVLPVVKHVECAWTGGLGEQVAEALAGAERGDASVVQLCAAAGPRMPPSLHDRVVAGVRARRVGERGLEALGRLADTLRYRSRMHKEFR
ncbi:hypothetical protein LP52_24330 [Streptomonospora alba]|uniref:Uncharacterized protein n=1 Tax=Streptomonospora alba TaxID=183763 RepID=A0A0C2FZT8_9ACTN|nr:hypothetical protein LP52_24330 [Streptomonospora alba]